MEKEFKLLVEGEETAEQTASPYFLESFEGNWKYDYPVDDNDAIVGRLDIFRETLYTKENMSLVSINDDSIIVKIK